MGQVSIDINGRNYGIACDDGEENHIISLGGDLAARVKDLADAVGQVGDARLLVMAGLLLIDELNQRTAAGQSGEADGETDSSALLDAMTGRIEALARQAEQVAERIEPT
ncbi:MAG: cell division protein ZapA [Rhodospirillales bacterium]